MNAKGTLVRNSGERGQKIIETELLNWILMVLNYARVTVKESCSV